MSSNGTYVNAKLVGKEKLHTLVNGDEIALLNPNPSSHVGGGAAGCKPTHYHYLYQDLRPAPRPAPQPSPPKQMPRTKLLQVRWLPEAVPHSTPAHDSCATHSLPMTHSLPTPSLARLASAVTRRTPASWTATRGPR